MAATVAGAGAEVTDAVIVVDEDNHVNASTSQATGAHRQHTAGARQKRQRNSAAAPPHTGGESSTVIDLTSQPDNEDDEVMVVSIKRAPRRRSLGQQQPIQQQQHRHSGHQRHATTLAPPAQQLTWQQQAPPQPPLPPSPEPGYKCPVCLEAIKEMCTTPCGHVFCQGCLTECVKVMKKCPKCRKGITLKQIHRIYLD